MLLQLFPVCSHHSGSRPAAVHHLAAVGGQSGGDGQQSALNDHTLSIIVGVGALYEGQSIYRNYVWAEYRNITDEKCAEM